MQDFYASAVLRFLGCKKEGRQVDGLNGHSGASSPLGELFHMLPFGETVSALASTIDPSGARV